MPTGGRNDVFALVATLAVGCITGALSYSFVTNYFHKRKPVKARREQPMKKRESLKIQHTHTIEFCVSDIASAIAAVHGGATSLELCANRLEGGVSPSLGFVEECVRVCRNLSVEVHVLVRPRPGGFVYDQEEFEVILRDISAYINAGVDGIVFGVLTSDNQVDEVRMKAVRQISEGVKLTFHRAFDLCINKDEAICSVIKLGCDRLLTSGQEGTAIAGKENLKVLQQKYGEYIRIIAAAGVKIENARSLIADTGILGVHTGSGVDYDYVETHHYIDPQVFGDMMRWKGANIDLVEAFVNKCMKGWGGGSLPPVDAIGSDGY